MLCDNTFTRINGVNETASWNNSGTLGKNVGGGGGGGNACSGAIVIVLAQI